MNRSIYQALTLALLTIFSLKTDILGISHSPNRETLATITDEVPDTLDHFIYLPFILKPLDTNDHPQGPRINVPYFPTGIRFPETAVHWFGEVRGPNNYTDIRVGYSQTELVIQLAIIDRHAWYDTTPTVDTLTEWDSASIYLDITGQHPTILSPHSYEFVGQLNWWEDRANYQTAYRGGPSGWSQSAIPFTTGTVMRGELWNDNNRDDRGWKINFRLPFSSFGLASPPAPGTVWNLGITVYDRDDSNGTPISPKHWPQNIDSGSPSTWGEIHFGLPDYSPTGFSTQSTWVIRHRLNGATVPDADVGGHTTCGDGLEFWNEWGDQNYANQIESNIQNQADIADWPCFSKYYLTFPLDTLPEGKVVVSANLTMHQFGGSNPAQAQPSLIQVLLVGEDWDENTLTWNNAPMALENLSQAWVQPLPGFPGWPGIPTQWDLSLAVYRAYTAHSPLRLVLYSADSAIDSGKYFSTSDVGDWNEIARPTLTIHLGEPSTP